MRYFNTATGHTGHISLCVILLMGIMAWTFPAYGVTDKEMEQARTITAQTYLRYANDGSGYLDDLHPTTMADLQKSLKATEKENLKAFQAISVPKDYASWDKDKLVQYWSVTFFKSPGLSDKGKIGKTRVKSRLLRMSVTPPSKKEEPKKDEPKKDEPKKEEAVKEEPRAAETSENPAPAMPEELTAPDAPGEDAAASASGKEQQEERLKEMAAAADSLKALEEGEQTEEHSRKRKDSTWIYIVILCVLVAVVVGLVFFASSTMKKSREDDYSDDTPEGRNRRKRLEGEIRAEVTEEAMALADSEKEMKEKAVRETENMRQQLLKSRQEMAAIAAERDALARKVGALEEKLKAALAAPTPAPAPAPTPAPAAAPAPPAPKAAPAPDAAHKSKIYLGRVNSRGLFVRADRGLNLEGSVYVLETEDGFSGSYRVVRNREVWARLLENPAHWLEGGCVIRVEDSEADVASIVTDSAGTAVFENSCWRVIRKAKIHFE
ncbi:MAG: hypothetical protein K2O24_05590 [Muribaculaceae bacterium]|nr:hypothetical protein [Muribaculaceae bacterium]